jgi:hypothetical protein
LVSSRWRLGVVALVNRYRRAGASALTTLLCWRIGVVALAHFGIVALRLGITALARLKRARDGARFIKEKEYHNIQQVAQTHRQTHRHRKFLCIEKTRKSTRMPGRIQIL